MATGESLGWNYNSKAEWSPEGDVIASAESTPQAGNETVPVRDEILILHYFTRAKGTPLSNNTITYKELADGINYFPVFSKRTIQPIVNFFGSEPKKLVQYHVQIF